MQVGVAPHDTEVITVARNKHPIAEVGEHPGLQDPSIVDVDAEAVVPMDVQSVIGSLINDAIQWIDSEVSPVRAAAQEYYDGDDCGVEPEEGRSGIISTEVRDAHDRLMPQLLRVFFGAEECVVFVPQRADQQSAAEQQTQAVNFVVMQQNSGYSDISDVLHEGSLHGLGCAHAWWETSEPRRIQTMTGLTEDDLLDLMQDEKIELRNLRKEVSTPAPTEQPEESEGQPVDDAEPSPAPDATTQPSTFSASVVRIGAVGRVKIEAFPPEEFIYTDDAKRLDETVPIVGRRRKVLAWRLKQEGWDKDIVDTYASANGNTQLDTNEERLARNFNSDTSQMGQRAYTDDTREVLVTTVITVIDTEDGNGAVLRELTCFGDNFKIVKDEPIMCIPFAIGSAYKKPHKLVGSGLYQRLADLQQIQSEIQRGVLDSLAQTLSPETVVLENAVSMADVLNTETGRVVREKVPGAYREMVRTFVGAAAMPLLEFYDQKRDVRAGTPPQSAGLEADALQSSTKSGVDAAIQGGALQVERVARNFAEGFFKDLYRLVRDLLRQNQDQDMIIRLNGEFVTIDPRTWEADFDCVVNTNFGGGLHQEREGLLSAVAEDIKEWIGTMGPGNPVAGVGRYLNVQKKRLQLAGYKDTTQFYNDLPLDWAPPPAPPQPDPATMLAQIEQQKAQDQAANDKAKLAASIAKDEATLQLDREERAARLELERTKMMLEDDRARDKQAADQALAQAEIEAKYHVQLQVQMAKVAAEQEASRAAAQAQGGGTA